MDALKPHLKQVHERWAAQPEYICDTCDEVFHNLAPFWANGQSANSKPSMAAKHLCQDDSGRKTLLQSHKITFCVNDKCHVNLLRKS